MSELSYAPDAKFNGTAKTLRASAEESLRRLTGQSFGSSKTFDAWSRTHTSKRP